MRYLQPHSVVTVRLGTEIFRARGMARVHQDFNGDYGYSTEVVLI